MKYNVYISEEEKADQWWYNLEEAPLKDIASAYHSKSDSFLLPGRGRINFTRLNNIAIFENSKNATEKDIEDIMLASGDYIRGQKVKKYKNLEHFGIDVSNHYLSAQYIIGIKDWSIIHPIVLKVANKKFNDSHYADAVESAFKELNDVIKKEYKNIKGTEEDGDALMRKAFSVNQPIFKLADQTKDSGKNVQQGYMDIFAGAMKGIRNPIAHANLDVHPEEAWELIVLASHLFKMWDKRL
jgi:uncharacterized protein (TIGR02391 family)